MLTDCCPKAPREPAPETSSPTPTLVPILQGSPLVLLPGWSWRDAPCWLGRLEPSLHLYLALVTVVPMELSTL